MTGPPWQRHAPALWSCAVDGVACGPERISVRSMNFGQRWRTDGIVEVRYRLTLPRAFLFDEIEGPLAEYIADAQRFETDGLDGFEEALCVAGWPALDAILEEPPLADEALEYFAHDLLLAWFGDGAPGQRAAFVLNTVDRAVWRDGQAVIEGAGRRGDRPVRFQDD